ncbi:MAG: polyribonucleotide nucleotidyltransferase [Deltaproteobacteria bacterium]|nr:polyribonucleotide nucleotidyltransferase [Deltaproteobacteria bacterium]
MFIRESVELNGREFSIETGRMAKQADGAVVVRYGDSMVLVTAVTANKPKEISFLPLTVDYVEKTFAAGKIPGGYFKREGRPTELEILTSRIIDRPCRPLFPKGYNYETQLIATVLSSDQSNATDVLALTGASAALTISRIPWEGPVAGVRVGRVDGQFIANPTLEEQGLSDMNIVMAVSRDAITMVEGGTTRGVDEDTLIDALMFGHEACIPLLDLQEKIRAAVGRPKREFISPEPDLDVARRVEEIYLDRIREAAFIPEKLPRYAALSALEDEIQVALAEELPDKAADIEEAFHALKAKVVRSAILKEGRRIGGRRLDEVRPVTCEVGVLPRVHGSALFTRGETQALVTTTLGTSVDVQHIDALTGDIHRRFMLHYNFPPFSVGEVKFLRGASRREIGHGTLARRALTPMLPSHEDFPYTIRVVSEILESNGSSSMATTCGGSLALMDAGVPTVAPVAGIAMGLVEEGDQIAILTDILGDEDHLGDMDFKVTGTREGITAVQMDIKIKGLSRDILKKALYQARDGRFHILDVMHKALAAPRTDLSPHAPRIITIKVKPDRIRDIIGSGGKTIKAIIDQTGVAINVEDDGTVTIASPDGDASNRAIDIIKGLTKEPEVGKYYLGIVRKVVEFGAFVEILPGTDGLVHISELDKARVRRVEDVCHEGDEMLVKVLAVDAMGKIRLSRKEALDKDPSEVKSALMTFEPGADGHKKDGWDVS